MYLPRLDEIHSLPPTPAKKVDDFDSSGPVYPIKNMFIYQSHWNKINQ